MSKYVLVITEKTSSAKKIAKTLDELEKPKTFIEKEVTFCAFAEVCQDILDQN